MKKITPIFCLLLICAMMLSWVQPVAAADDAPVYSYNDIELPDINSVWEYYEHNKEDCPYAFLWKWNNVIYVYFCSVPVGFNGTSMYSEDVYWFSYKFSGGQWVWNTCTTNNTLNIRSEGKTFWANYDVLYPNGNVYLAASVPEPVGGNLSIYLYDYVSSEPLVEFAVTPPCIITATSTGIEINDSSTGDLLHSYLWSGSGYFAGFSLGIYDYVEYEIGQSFECTSSDTPISLYLYSNQYPVLDGVWQANDSIKGSAAFSSDLNFSVGDVRYTGINYQFSGSVKTLSYLHSSGQETVYVDQWYGNSKKTIDLGPTSQIVSAEFYSWFTSNFTRTGDSEASNVDVCQVQIFDYGSGALVQLLKLPVPHIIYATAIGIQIEGYSTVETLFSYTWSGAGDFVGFSTLSRDWVEYEVGSNFVNLSSDVTLYLYGDGDTEGPIDPDEPDPTDPTEPDATDPTEPGDSPSTEPTVDPLDKEKDEANKQGNDSIDQILDVIPNVTDDIVAAYDNLIRVLKYEGTTAKLMTPAIVVPELPGSVPEFVILEPQEIDFEYWFNQVPSSLMAVVRALFTGALILYCGYEVYDLIEYFVSLRSKSKK